MASSGIIQSVLAAVQASLSVLLVIFYGVLAARFKLLDQANAKVISKICVRMFLPALLLTKLGSEVQAGRVGRYGIVLAWALVCHFVSFLIGLSARWVFKFPNWITVAVMFNNTTSYPLLLMESLHETGILKSLLVTNGTDSHAIEGAKSYFLIFATVSSCLTFAVGPRLVDTENTPDPADKDDEDEEIEDYGEDAESSAAGPSEETALLVGSRKTSSSASSVLLHPSEAYEATVNRNRRPSYVSKKRWLLINPHTRWILLFLYDFLNAPLLGAVAGVIIGLVPPLNRAFFNDVSDGGFLRSWLTESWENIGRIFVPLPLVIAGVSLYYSSKGGRNSTGTKTPWSATTFILFARFIAWPAVSIPLIYGLVTRTNTLGDDPILWFTLMIMPAGPPAMKLITMVQVSGAGEEDEHKIAKILTASYVVSPIFALTVVGALKASQAAIPI